jgi:hypothetical protein
VVFGSLTARDISPGFCGDSEFGHEAVDVVLGSLVVHFQLVELGVDINVASLVFL